LITGGLGRFAGFVLWSLDTLLGQDTTPRAVGIAG
jgi:hypothetical protein